jgi:hypothetical protein
MSKINSNFIKDVKIPGMETLSHNFCDNTFKNLLRGRQGEVKIKIKIIFY